MDATLANPETSTDPEVRAAWRLLTAHEDATRDGYRADTYPAADIDDLARALHAARGNTSATCNAHTRSRDLWTARAVLRPLRDADNANNAIWRVETLETDWRRSYCGNWIHDSAVSGPPSDDETDILARAKELDAAGHTVQIVREAAEREVMWQSQHLPWAPSRVTTAAESIIDGTWKLNTTPEPPDTVDLLDGKASFPRTALASLGDRSTRTRARLGEIIPTMPDLFVAQIPVPTGARLADGTPVYHSARRQWGTVNEPDGAPAVPDTHWVVFDGDDTGAVTVSTELLTLMVAKPRQVPRRSRT